MKTSYNFLILITLVLLSSCKFEVDETIEQTITQNQEEAKKAINKVLFDQRDNWNNADIPAFMEGYWKSEDLIFVGRSGITTGWENTKNNYLKGYPDKEAMGKLDFEVLRLDSLATDIYRMVGNFQLQRKEDKPSGIFTLIWRFIDDKWLIVSDHTTG